ncbi:MAG: hypothetical protein ABIO79_04290 [Ferruginibacter sp.]
MIRLITIHIALLIIFGCNNLNESKKIVEPQESFILNANELNLLNFDSCSYQISLDTIQSISKYHRLKNSFFDTRKNLTEKFCISFSFKENYTGKAKTVIINSTPFPYRSRGAIITPDKFIIAKIRDSTYLFSILGIVHAFDGSEAKELYKYVKEFYLSSSDTANMKDKFIQMEFPSDTVAYIEKILSQAVMGYILAQREFSFEIYKKELQNATKQELIALRTSEPRQGGDDDAKAMKLVTKNYRNILDSFLSNAAPRKFLPTTLPLGSNKKFCGILKI